MPDVDYGFEGTIELEAAKAVRTSSVSSGLTVKLKEATHDNNIRVNDFSVGVYPMRNRSSNMVHKLGESCLDCLWISRNIRCTRGRGRCRGRGVGVDCGRVFRREFHIHNSVGSTEQSGES